PDNAAVDVCPVVDDSIIADCGWTVDDNPTLDLDLIPEKYGAIELGVGCDLDALAGPDTAANVVAQLFHLDTMVQHIAVGTHVLANISHVAPIAIGDIAE